MIDFRLVRVIAQKELREALRNRWFAAFTAAFVGLALALSALMVSTLGAVFGHTETGLAPDPDCPACRIATTHEREHDHDKALQALERADQRLLQGYDPSVDEEPSLHFALLRKIAERNGLPELSMGMSGDYRIAIAFGATLVRIGTAIFGERESPPTA